MDCDFEICKYKFKKVCNYADCYRTSIDNTYKVINESKILENKGIYAFVYEGKIYYIGLAHDRYLKDRVKQHFSNNDSGGLRTKLKDEDKRILEKCSLYVTVFGSEKLTKHDMLIEEALLIGTAKPQFNFYQTEKECILGCNGDMY